MCLVEEIHYIAFAPWIQPIYICQCSRSCKYCNLIARIGFQQIMIEQQVLYISYKCLHYCCTLLLISYPLVGVMLLLSKILVLLMLLARKIKLHKAETDCCKSQKDRNTKQLQPIPQSLPIEAPFLFPSKAIEFLLSFLFIF